MSRRPTIADVAHAAGVSQATVSNALSGQRYVESGTRERVRAAARSLGYAPNLRAQRLRTGQAHSVALLSSMPFAVAAGPSRLGFMMEIAAVAAATAIENGLALLLVPPPESARLRLDQLDTDAALLIEPVADDPLLEHFRARGIPVVCIGKPGPEAAALFVDLASAATADLMLEHLWAQGARRIALLQGVQRRNSYAETEARYAAFARAHGMDRQALRIDERGGEAAAEAACADLLRGVPDIDAICVPVDAFAIGALRAVHASGRRVPEDVKLVTRYDGLRARTASPPLTAVDLHLDEVAGAAVTMMLDLLAGRTSAAPQIRPPSLVVRASSWDAGNDERRV